MTHSPESSSMLEALTNVDEVPWAPCWASRRERSQVHAGQVWGELCALFQVVLSL